MKFAYKKYPSLEKIFVEDGITNNIVANFFTILKEINNGKPIAKADSKYFFTPYTIDDSLALRWKEYFSVNGVESDFASKVSGITEHFNKEYLFRYFKGNCYCFGMLLSFFLGRQFAVFRPHGLN